MAPRAQLRAGTEVFPQISGERASRLGFARAMKNAAFVTRTVWLRVPPRDVDPGSLPCRPMGFSVGALRGGVERRGIVDHRLARRMLINQVRCGRIALEQVCDAHPELIRAARNVGTQTSTRCPICEESDLKLVTYVFGPRLSAQGRCVSTAKEMRALNARNEELSAYVVEACVECRWNHLLRVIPVGGRP